MFEERSNQATHNLVHESTASAPFEVEALPLSVAMLGRTFKMSWGVHRTRPATNALPLTSH